MISQRDLVQELKVTIDAAASKAPSAYRDLARARLKKLRHENWNTIYVLNNISIRRAKYLQSIGWPVPYRWLHKDWSTEKRDEPDD